MPQIITDTLGLLLAVPVIGAGVQDSTAGRTLLDQAAADHPGLRKVWVDGGYRKHFVEHAATLGIDLEIVQQPSRTLAASGVALASVFPGDG